MNTISEPTGTPSHEAVREAGHGPREDGRGARKSRRGGRWAGSATLLTLFFLGGCIQGPWDYYPKNPKVFKGIWMTGYALAGKPLEEVCLERLLGLNEEYTSAFPFYDQAEVTVRGRFGDGSGSVVLSPISRRPNCFVGASASLIQKGESYDIEARITWDSAGRNVTSVLTATANVPKEFSIHRTAAAPGFAMTGNAPTNIFSPEFVTALPPKVREVIQREFLDSLEKLQAANDTAGISNYIKANSAKYQKRLLDLLKDDQIIYNDGDTLFYINGPLNTLSHYFSNDRSADVGAVLITHRFDTLGARPETAFDNVFGQRPDTSRYFFPGELRRLVIYPDAKDAHGYNLLDSLGVVNTWFHTRVNRLYFYGFESAYYAFVSTAIDGEGDARIKPRYNVEGGRGIFVGAVPDSFNVNIVTDSLTKVYPLQEARAARCTRVGWSSEKDCRDFYPIHCANQKWKPSVCRVDAVNTCLRVHFDLDTLEGMCGTVGGSASQDSVVARAAQTLFCIEGGFPSADQEPVCGPVREACLEQSGITSCKRALWDYCKDNDWRRKDNDLRPDPCKPGLVSYCRDQPRRSEVLCRNADAYCREHPEEKVCQ